MRCLNKHRFCFDCMLDDHRPCTCDDLKRWLIKCKDDSETYNWCAPSCANPNHPTLTPTLILTLILTLTLTQPSPSPSPSP